MDDIRTQQALDELADLFLTGQGPVADPPPPPPPDVPPVTPVTPAISSATSAAGPLPIESKRDELVGPAPIRLRPKLTEKPKAVMPVSYTPPIEGNAPLRLQPEADGSPIASIGEVEVQEDAAEGFVVQDESGEFDDRVVDQSVAVEAVILGNLPGLSGPWLTQYAQLLAQQEGPVAILHVDDDLIDLELVEPTNRDAPDRGVSLRMPPGGGKIDPRTILEALLDSVDSPDSVPKTVLVHVDPQHDEGGLARALCIDDWTLMCGADDLAIVAGYKMLKSMVEKDSAVAGKRLGLMIMGSDPEASRGAARKFQSASASFLHTPVQLLGWQKQMVPVNLRHLGRFEDVEAVWPRLAEWFEMVAPVEAVGDEEMAESVSAVMQESVTEPIATIAELPIPAIETRARAVAAQQVAFIPEPTSRPKSSELFDELLEAPVGPGKLGQATRGELAEAQTPAPTRLAQPEPVIQAEPAPGPAIKPASEQPQATPAVSPAAQPAEPVAIDEPDLVELLMAGTGAVAGGIALEARCPHQSQTRLMLDQAGRLHLLCRHDSEGFDSLQSAMVDLMQASHWVREHLELLALTQRQCRFDVSCEPVLHLFTDRADWATALIARLGESLKLHLLQEVVVGEESAWFCTPLN